MIPKYINLEPAYEYFFEESANEKVNYVGLFFNKLSNFYEVLFEPPVDDFYTVIKIYGTI